METLKINIKLRPIKFAFLVDPNDTSALIKVIEINTFLWGGLYNPIIPTFKRKPKVYKNIDYGRLTSRQIVLGYLDAYDPDYVVLMEDSSFSNFNSINKRIIKFPDILSIVKEEGIPKYGIGFFELLNYFIKEELKFIRRKPLNICFPNFKRPFSAFMAAFFGVIPDFIGNIIKENYDNILSTERPFSGLSDYIELISSKKYFFNDIANYKIKINYPQGCDRDKKIFYMDASKNLDIINYWNLRAVGWDVIPLPKQICSNKDTIKFIENLIEENYFPNFYNPKIYHYTTLVKSYFSSEKDLENFKKSLNISESRGQNMPKVVLQRWYPRIWDEWARGKDHAICCEIEAKTKEIFINIFKNEISLKTLDPDFISEFGLNCESRFANEIEFKSFSEKEIYAEVIPEGNDRKLARAIRGFSLDKWRFSKKGLVYLSRRPNYILNFSVPLAQNVFVEWLKIKGWNVELSSSGYIAKQMIKQLGGLWGISNIANEGIIKLLQKMSGEKSLKENIFQGKIKEITNKKEFIKDSEWVLNNLLQAKMFILGVEIQCPICKQRSWYSINDFNYEIHCPKCLEKFPIPSNYPKNEIRWSYRTSGTFSLPKKAYGAYSVLLTIRFFSRLIDAAITPIMSFNASKNRKKIEVDLGLFFKESMFRNTKNIIIFAECKTYNIFYKKDINKMKFITKQFPGAVIVFATLRKSFTKNEKKIIKTLVNKSRKDYWKSTRTYNPILLLTGVELFSESEIPYCWRNKGEKYKKFEKFRVYTDYIEKLCDITQQIYLDMKSIEDEYHEIHNKKRKMIPTEYYEI